MNLVDITCDTSLDEILDHSTVEAVTESINRVSPVMKVIYNRATYLEKGISSGGLGDMQMIDGTSVYRDTAQSLYDSYDSIFSDLPVCIDNIEGEARKRENFELNALARKLIDKIDSLNENFKATTFDDDNEDDQIKKRAMQMDIAKYEAKLVLVRSRLAKVPIASTGAGSGSGSAASTDGVQFLFNTGSDDNNKVYGVDCKTFGKDDLRKILANGYRSNWKLGEKRLGLNGALIGSNDEYYGLYNSYYECEYNGKKVYIVCSDLYNTEPSDVNMKQSSPILYITEDENGHKICYDKSGSAVSFNTAMNIMDVNRCSYSASQGSITSYPKVGEFDAKITTNNAPTPYAPTQYDEIVMKENGDSESTKNWRSSEKDANGNAWEQFSSKTFDNSSTFNSIDLSSDDYINNYTVYSKDKGDMGKINVLLKDNNSHEKYFSIQQPDGSYLYYDSDCNPITDEEVLNNIH